MANCVDAAYYSKKIFFLFLYFTDPKNQDETYSVKVVHNSENYQ